MDFQTIRIEGSILSADILDKIEMGETGFQQPKDFGYDTKVKVKDEIARAWADANAQWKIYKSRIENIKESETGTTETRKYWMIPFLGLLGYDITPSNAEYINNKSYAISHRDTKLDRFPVQVVSFKDSLDKKREDSGPRMSPHSLMQEYLNLTEHLYAVVTNGLILRLLRDNSRLVKLSYVEFDLERMFEEEHYADFAVLFRLLHSSRMPQRQETAPDSIIEKYHQDALDSGSRIRNGLSHAVKRTLLELGSGFLINPNNQELINTIENNKISADEYHRYLLRIVYRLLFLMVIEERGLVYPDKANSKLKEIYYKYYSIGRLRTLCEKNYLSNERHNDYWHHLQNCFKIYEDEKYGKPLEIKPLSGDLFGYDAIGVLNNSTLSNKVVTECIRNLNSFRNETTGHYVKVNYRSLNVEEFGSVYEGLLEYNAVIKKVNGKYEYSLVEGSERSSSGSHYTPDELVSPLIKHSLDYIIEDKLKEKHPENALLSITVCDVACGSGHILLNAARRIAVELAKVRTGEDQPSPANFRSAIKDVIKNCIHGVDKNPLAVELCKVALWLESHNPGEPISFLDHRIKCGDSIVGLAHKEELERGIANEAFNLMPGDDKEVTKEFKKKNNDEIKSRLKQTIPLEYIETLSENIKNVSKELNTISKLPEITPEDVTNKKKKYKELSEGSELWRLKVLADMQVAQFFIPKTADNKQKLITDSEYYRLLQSKQMPQGMKADEAISESQKRKFFHWFLEFPEIFENGGFDCILGNPPYLGGKKISGNYGSRFLSLIHNTFKGVGGQSDLISYFIRRIYILIKNNSFLAIITTNSISEGDTREGSLEFIVNLKSEICFAIKSVKWPGVANLNVSLISIYKGHFKSQKYLNNKLVDNISVYLDEESFNRKPNILLQNQNMMYRGVDFGGTGFILENEVAEKLLKNDLYYNVIKPLINGEEINTNPLQEPERYIINFYDFDESKAKTYQELYNILVNKVKPYRESGNDIVAKKKWWVYKRNKIELYRELNNLSFCFVTAFTSKYLAFSKVRTNIVISNALNILKTEDYSIFTLLQSSLHDIWVRKYSSSLESRLRYSSTDVFETYPFPSKISTTLENMLRSIGTLYYETRKMLMCRIQLGLTKTYNLFHYSGISLEQLNNNDKLLISFQKHLSKTSITISFEEAVKEIVRLRDIHKQIDESVLDAYGWSDIDLKHDFYEIDYLPENDRIRYSIHPDARKEILKRLLELNHKIHEEEVAAGLWDKKTTKTKKPKDDYPDRVSEGTIGIFG